MTIQDVINLNDNVIRSWNDHDVEKFQSYCDPKIVWNDVAYPKPFNGKEGAKTFFNQWMTAFPDFKVKIQNTVATENSIACEFEFTGTNTGTLQLGDGNSVPATRKKVTSKGTYFAKVRDGKFIQVNTYPDMIGMMMQLGLMHEMHA